MTTEQDQISNDILGYLEQHQQKELLRFVSVGSVDDGKSTLIFFHAQGPPNSDRRDVYFDQLVIQLDDRLGVNLVPKPWP